MPIRLPVARHALVVLLLGPTLGCEPSPTAPSTTTVTTIVTLPPAAAAPVTTAPTCTPTATCPNPCTPTSTCTGTTGPGARVPEILAFGADSPKVIRGGAALLRWEIADPSAQVRIDPGVGSVGTVGFVLVFPTQTTTYTLTARNALGIAQRQFTVFVFDPD
jgi:hypothetical protein